MPESTKPTPTKGNQTGTYSAKQIATRIGTDARTLRKFFRSPQSNFEPVGRGGRYEYPVEDLDDIREQFTKWKAEVEVRAAASKFRKKSATSSTSVIEDDDEMAEFDDEEDE